METVILDGHNQENIVLCADIIRQGGLVAFPTETVYGLGADALSETAVAGIFAAKNRQEDNPLIVHTALKRDVMPLVAEIPAVFETLAEKYWPGPLTLIMKKSGIIPDNVTAGLDTVAIRMPEHPTALALILACGGPIAAPSANPSGTPSPTNALHVKADLDGRIQYILDGGSCRVGLESTVLDISGTVPRILRPGGVTYDELKTVLGVVDFERSPDNEAPRSPGMKYRHYAPKSPLTAVLGPPAETAEYIMSRMSGRTAALMFDDYAFDNPFVVTLGASRDHAAQASRLFGALRLLDSMDISEIYVQTPDEDGLGQAVANRIKKAAGNNIVVLGNR